MWWGCFCCFLSQAVLTTYHVYAATLRIAGSFPICMRKTPKLHGCQFQNSSTQMLLEMELTETDFLEGGENTETK